jgi:hypothetical protein
MNASGNNPDIQIYGQNIRCIIIRQKSDTLEQSAKHIALFPHLNYSLLMFWLSRQWVLLGSCT